MKKVRNILVLSLVLLSVVSLGSVAGTYAKYTTSESTADSARVAKFGVELTATADEEAETLFTKGDGTIVTDTAAVVAPGTSGTLTGFTITGAPEVATSVKYSATLELTGWTIDTSTEYMPLMFKVGDEWYYVGKGSIGDVAALITAVQDAIAAKSKNYNADETLSDSLSVEYKWLFDETEATSYNGLAQTNANDTKLGNLETAPKVKLTVNATVEQRNTTPSL